MSNGFCIIVFCLCIAEFVAKAVRIKYPIEDSLVEPSSDGSILPNKPAPLSDFSLPMDCIGPLLMVWNFCTLFEKVIKLSPFPLEDLARAVDCKEKEHMLLKEAHHALIKLVLSDPAISKAFPELRTRKAKVNLSSMRSDTQCLHVICYAIETHFSLLLLLLCLR
jgi:hypothetical protein